MRHLTRGLGLIWFVSVYVAWVIDSRNSRFWRNLSYMEMLWLLANIVWTQRNADVISLVLLFIYFKIMPALCGQPNDTLWRLYRVACISAVTKETVSFIPCTCICVTEILKRQKKNPLENLLGKSKIRSWKPIPSKLTWLYFDFISFVCTFVFWNSDMAVMTSCGCIL